MPGCAMAQGPYCFDVDGNKYIDYIGSWGPAIVGAANDEVNAALHTQIDKGTSFGAPCELEVSLCPGSGWQSRQPVVADTRTALPSTILNPEYCSQA
jgi:Aminotransferase class-III